jgi:hypothetical protein
MTRAEILAHIEELQTKLRTHEPDPLKTEEEQLAVTTPLVRSLAAFQERLRRLDAHRS